MKGKSILWLILGLALILVYGYLDPEKVHFPKCPFRTLTGLLCPGCGSQRAIHQVLHGHFLEAFQLNALFLPAVFYSLTGLVTSVFFPKQWPRIRKSFFGLHAAYITLAVILVFSVWRNIH